MKLSRFTLLAGIGLTALSAASPACAQDNPAGGADANEVAISLLFVQNARGLTYDEAKGTLTLKDVSPVVTFFSDRPHRIAGHVLLAGFLKAWDEGSDSFKKDPPNVELSILEPGRTRSVVLELSDPRADASQLTYKAKVLEGELPASGGACSLFIDGLFYGAARGAAGGAIIGAACGNPGEGAAIGAAVGGVASAARDRRRRENEAELMEMKAMQSKSTPAQTSTTAPATPPKTQSPPPATAEINVPNDNGSYTPVKLTQVPDGWKGPKGEIYPSFPTVDELKKMY